ncbi:MAG: ribose 5-phosphate isomerase B [Flavobacteriales bacterium]|jgi:ribose 5-phosphate isomerase B
MEILIACDHAGYDMKLELIESGVFAGHEVEDLGTHNADSMDYPDAIHPLASAINKGENKLGIILCGSGNGVNMTANKYTNVRSALCWTAEIAELARQHNNANVLAIPARFIDFDVAKDCVSAFVNTEFEGGRHQRRVEKISMTC